ncbi:MAG: DNA internalization-related competence protein ComEC/Rec2 [Clostridiales bacterium]|nr:DNA internalization-related competence protein ComEC/Rec2 [Clostridiales bacterium]
MKRPMPIFTAFLILGIIWGSLSLNTPWFLALSFFAFALGFVFFKFFKLKFLILLPCLFALGFILCFNRVNFSDSEYDLFCASGDEVSLSGEVTGALGSGKIIKTDRNVKIIVYTDRDLIPGDAATLTGKLRALSPQYNPSDFDEIQYYTCRGIYYKMYSPDLEITGLKKTLSYYLYALKTKAAEALDEIYSEENSAILKARLLGDKTYLSDEIKLLYKNSGIYHILAISGLHISLIAGVFMYFFKKKRHSIIIMAFLAIYCLFTGLSPSAVRAVIMMWVLLIGRMLGRKYDLVSSLAFSAFLILVFNPLYLFDCGFIYSYCSVLGIALFAKPFGKITGRVPVKNKIFREHVLDALAASLSAVIITKLVNMYYFYNFTTCDFITNLVVLPSVVVVVASGAASLGLYLIGLPLYRLFALAASLVLYAYKLLAAAVSSIPFSLITTGRPVFAFSLLYILFIVFLCFAFKFKRKSFAFCAVLLLALGIQINSYELSKDQVTFLYAGQGDSAVGITEGEVFIVDGGGTKTDPDEADEGTYTLLPYLELMGKTRVDRVFISHIDNDHMKGIYEILDQIEIGEIYLPIGDYSSELYTLFKEKAAENSIPIHYLSAGDTAGESFICLYPDEEQAKKAADVNDGSMVLRASVGEKTVLFTGDISKSAESKILNADTDVNADIIKIPHHGSKYSSGEEFISAVSPALAVISCGINNNYGFPSDEALETLEGNNIPVFITSENGAVTLKPNKKGIKVKTALP